MKWSLLNGQINARMLGYDFTVEEFNAYMEERVVSLSESELEAVSGGIAKRDTNMEWWWF